MVLSHSSSWRFKEGILTSAYKRSRHCDALRFHWKRDDLSELEVLRFTRALFGLMSSHLLLGVVVDCHLETWEEKIQNLWLSFKKTCVWMIFCLVEQQHNKHSSERISLHKLHSNVPQQEGNIESNNRETTFAKQQLQPPEGSRASLLGLE